MNRNFIKSPLNYTGGKYQILNKIFEVIGDKKYGTFVDLFGGGFNVGINANAKKVIYNDQILYLVDLFSYFREVDTNALVEEIKSIIKYYDLSKKNLIGYNRLRVDYNSSKKIIYLFVLACYSFNHQLRYNNKHEFNTSFGKDRSSYNPMIEANLIDFCNSLKSKNVDFYSKDFRDFDLSTLSVDDIVYCDPPYLISTGSYNDGKRGFKDWTDKEEIDLLELLDQLNNRGIRFVLSNVLYHKGESNDLLIEWAKKYNIHYIDKNYNNCNYHIKDKGNVSIEVLITNFGNIIDLGT